MITFGNKACFHWNRPFSMEETRRASEPVSSKRRGGIQKRKSNALYASNSSYPHSKQPLRFHCYLVHGATWSLTMATMMTFASAPSERCGWCRRSPPCQARSGWRSWTMSTISSPLAWLSATTVWGTTGQWWPFTLTVTMTENTWHWITPVYRSYLNPDPLLPSVSDPSPAI